MFYSVVSPTSVHSRITPSKAPDTVCLYYAHMWAYWSGRRFWTTTNLSDFTYAFEVDRTDGSGDDGHTD